MRKGVKKKLKKKLKKLVSMEQLNLSLRYLITQPLFSTSIFDL
jgi:hypothetical protein